MYKSKAKVDLGGRLYGLYGIADEGRKKQSKLFFELEKKHFDFYHHENRWIEDVRKVPGKQIDISSIFKQTDITNFPLQIHNILVQKLEIDKIFNKSVNSMHFQPTTCLKRCYLNW